MKRIDNTEKLEIQTSKILKQTYHAVKAEKPFYYAVIVYSIFISLISIAIPISVQSLVNKVTFGVMIQPIIVITGILFVLLIFSTVLNTLMTKVIEQFNYHFFARSVENITLSLVGSSPLQLITRNQISFANRYFDIMTVQKSISAILSEGVYIVLQVLIGLLLISLYHPYFIVFDFLLFGSLFLIWKLFSQGAINTAIWESKEKYALASWLNELSRLNILFKRNANFAVKKSESLTSNYIIARKAHFRFLLAQILGLLIIYAFLSAFVIGVGGVLVIKGELSIGQLVAAELIVTLILTSLSKSGKLLEKIYDLSAAVDKLKQFDDLKGKETQIIPGDKLELHLPINQTEIPYSNLSLKLSDTNYNIHFKSNALKKWFVGVFTGHQDLSTGKILLPNSNQEVLTSTETFYKTFYTLSFQNIFQGSIKENIAFDSDKKNDGEIIQILNALEIKDRILSLENGLYTQLHPSGHPLSSEEVLLVEIVRSILLRPQFIIVTDIFKILPNSIKHNFVNFIRNKTDIKLIFIGDVFEGDVDQEFSIEEFCS